MAIQITTAADRQAAKPKTNIVIAGPAGIGKTFQIRTLDPATTLVVDLEAGIQAIGDWPGDVLDVRRQAQALGWHPWEFARAIACLMSGPDPAAGANGASQFYSRQAFEFYEAQVGPASMFEKYDTVFWDSVTVAGRHSFSWSQTQPDAISEKTGKYDGRGAYGRHGQEMVTWLTQIQHIPHKSTVLACILDEDVDDFKRPIYTLQIDGGKASKELPGIFDCIVSLVPFKVENGQPVLDFKGGTERAFVCHKTNGYGLPAKTRSGSLNLFEPPNLAALMRKIATGERLDTVPQLTMPGASA